MAILDQPGVAGKAGEVDRIGQRGDSPVAASGARHGGGAMMNMSDNGVWPSSISLALPEKPGKSIASAKGEIHLLLQVAAVKVEVTDVDKKLHQNVQVGTQTMIINQLEVKDNIIHFQVVHQQQIG